MRAANTLSQNVSFGIASSLAVMSTTKSCSMLVRVMKQTQVVVSMREFRGSLCLFVRYQQNFRMRKCGVTTVKSTHATDVKTGHALIANAIHIRQRTLRLLMSNTASNRQKKDSPKLMLAHTTRPAFASKSKSSASSTPNKRIVLTLFQLRMGTRSRSTDRCLLKFTTSVTARCIVCVQGKLLILHSFGNVFKQTNTNYIGKLHRQTTSTNERTNKQTNEQTN